MSLEEDLEAATADLDLEDDEREIEEESAEEEPTSSEEEESEEEPEEGGDPEEDDEAEEEEPAAKETEGQQQIKNAAVQRIKDQYGIDLTDQFADDDSLLQAFVNQRSLIGQRNDDAQFGKNIRENPAGFFQQYAPQMGYTQGQQQAPGQQQQASSGVPEYNPDWINQVERDDNGAVVSSKPGFDPSIPQKLRAALEYAEKRNRQLIFSPEDAIGPLVEQAARRIFDQSRWEIEQGFQHQLAEQKINDDGQQWFRDNYSWLADESGNRPSQLGQAFTHHFNRAMQQTGGNQEFAIEHGMSKIQGLGQNREALATQKKKKRPPKTAQRSADLRSSRGSSDEAEFEEGESLYQALKRATSDMDM